MKVKITKQRIKTVLLPSHFLEMSAPDIIRWIHINARCNEELLPMIRALMEKNKIFDIVAGITKPNPTECRPEYVVSSVQYERYELLDYFFDNKFVSPDFVSETGSPLILYAMQTGIKMFRYLLGKGARLVISGDLVRNTGQHQHLTAVQCARGDRDMLNVLFNVVLNCVGGIRVPDTIATVYHIGKLLGRPEEVLNRFKSIHHGGMIKVYDRSRTAISVDTPLGRLLDLVRSGCTESEKFLELSKDCSEEDIRYSTAVAMTMDSTDTYVAMIRSLPDFRIQ